MRWITYSLIALFALSCSENPVNPANDESGKGTAAIICTFAAEGVSKPAATAATVMAELGVKDSQDTFATVKRLSMSGLHATGSIKLNPGLYDFAVIGYDRNGYVTYAGIEEDVTIEAGKTTKVYITLAEY